MPAIRVLALVLNAVWLIVGLVVGAVAALSGIGSSLGLFMALLLTTALASAFVILRDVRRAPRAEATIPKLVRGVALALNAAWLFLTTVGWATAVTGGPGPNSLEPALLAGALTVTVILNLVLILRPARRSEASAAAPV
jgi:ABC-type antimicrobial peptide transport system permease subunit